jgi:hypothetical protein
VYTSCFLLLQAGSQARSCLASPEHWESCFLKIGSPLLHTTDCAAENAIQVSVTFDTSGPKNGEAFKAGARAIHEHHALRSLLTGYRTLLNVQPAGHQMDFWLKAEIEPSGMELAAHFSIWILQQTNCVRPKPSLPDKAVKYSLHQLLLCGKIRQSW